MKKNKPTRVVTWCVREEKGRHSYDTEYILGGIGFFFIVLAILYKNFTVLPIIFIGVLIVIVSLRRPARCITYSLSPKGFSVDDTEQRWERIKEYNIIDDPGIKGRLLLKTESVSGTVMCPVYDDDMETIEGVLRQHHIKKNEHLLPTFVDHIARMF